MKKAYLFLLVTLFSFNANAATYWLGGAMNAYHCQQIAGSQGYPMYRFGGFYQGVYWWNGCFGIKNDNGGYSENTVYDVRTYGDAARCASDIEFRVDRVLCRAVSSSDLQCKTKRSDTNRVQELIYNVKCVSDVRKARN